ncbi:hypothetical protein U3516DRAFT_846753 [Neocallimastix sp. 'constans']
MCIINTCICICIINRICCHLLFILLFHSHNINSFIPKKNIKIKKLFFIYKYILKISTFYYYHHLSFILIPNK